MIHLHEAILSNANSFNMLSLYALDVRVYGDC